MSFESIKTPNTLYIIHYLTQLQLRVTQSGPAKFSLTTYGCRLLSKREKIYIKITLWLVGLLFISGKQLDMFTKKELEPLASFGMTNI